MNDVAAAGMVAILANNLPMFAMLKDMDDRGKVINAAFTVSAAFVLSDHLGFTAGDNSEMIIPVITAEITSGIAAVLMVLFMLKRISKY